jgi:hypothetical protein
LIHSVAPYAHKADNKIGTAYFKERTVIFLTLKEPPEPVSGTADITVYRSDHTSGQLRPKDPALPKGQHKMASFLPFCFKFSQPVSPKTDF